MAAGGLILIVSDDEDVAEMLRIALDAGGYRTAVAASARAALHRLRSTDTVCIVLDLGSKTIDARAFRDAQRRDRALAWIPAIAMSPDTNGGDTAHRLDAHALLRMPIDLDDLRAAVAHAIDAGSGRAARK